ncbi:PilZ domain-containing protein [Anoxynatronum sibiricum]|uniref:PilZ domain-containing protein n=1 Tax=Anoxynatronum sibiricum TaxID=210623 RepID=A0ABU9VRE0_9CLOT
MEEKRKLSRVLFQIRALIKKENMAFTGKVENLSLNGLLIHLTEKTDDLHSGDNVDVTIDLAGESSGLFINVTGQVVRMEEDGSLALHLTHIDLDSFVHLKNILAYNSGDYDKIMDEFMDSFQNVSSD